MLSVQGRATLVGTRKLLRQKISRGDAMQIAVLFFGILKEIVGRSSGHRRSARGSAGERGAIPLCAAVSAAGRNAAVAGDFGESGVFRRGPPAPATATKSVLLPPVSGGSAGADGPLDAVAGEVRIVREPHRQRKPLVARSSVQRTALPSSSMAWCATTRAAAARSIWTTKPMRRWR